MEGGEAGSGEVVITPFEAEMLKVLMEATRESGYLPR
jgi:hypothetical protein